MLPAFSPADVRATEDYLLARQSEPDQLMRCAAEAVASAARTMLEVCPGRVVILAGPGGNGGDGLYAGARLAADGKPVSALLVGDGAHAPALAAFRAAGGELLGSAGSPAQGAEPPAVDVVLPADAALLVDAVAGLASARGLAGTALDLSAQAAHLPILAVDIPTGVDAQTGAVATNAVAATVTVTFGYPRLAHALAPECGQVVVADLRLPGQPSFAEVLRSNHRPAAFIAQEPTLPARFDWAARQLGPQPVGCTGPICDPTPGIRSDKYSGGVVTVAAGSQAYPGAGILAATAAVRTTPAMVRFIGDSAITSLLPELVVHPDIASAGRCQCFVVGPGRGTDERAAAELAHILRSTAGSEAGDTTAAGAPPVLIDADALTLLARHPHLRALARAHPCTVLTPHEGEFARLYQSTFQEAVDPALGYQHYLRALARELESIVVLKGRITRVCAPSHPLCAVDSGHSYAATPGSGDVLAGVLGARLAFAHARGVHTTRGLVTEILHGLAIHAHASALAARTPEGLGIATASGIAAALPAATARLILAKR